jgi:hypothetical protein
MTHWKIVKGPDLKRLSYEIIRGLIQTKKQEAYTGCIEVNNKVQTRYHSWNKLNLYAKLRLGLKESIVANYFIEWTRIVVSTPLQK